MAILISAVARVVPSDLWHRHSRNAVRSSHRINLTHMDRWALYTAGKISKPTPSPQVLRLEAHGDFVIESIDRHPLGSCELHDLSGQCIAMDIVAIEDALAGPCSELYRPSLISRSSHVVNRRREKLWHESCRPGTPPLVTLQAAVGGFALGVVAAVTSVVFFLR